MESREGVVFTVRALYAICRRLRGNAAQGPSKEAQDDCGGSGSSEGGPCRDGGADGRTPERSGAPGTRVVGRGQRSLRTDKRGGGACLAHSSTSNADFSGRYRGQRLSRKRSGVTSGRLSAGRARCP